MPPKAFTAKERKRLSLEKVSERNSIVVVEGKLRVMLLEDQKKTIEFIQRGLEAAGYAVDSFEDPRRAIDALYEVEYDLLIIDINLPYFSGWEFVEKARNLNYDGLIFMLTALSNTDHKVRGFDAGADDYLTKPFSMDELLARLRAHWRRRGKTGKGSRLIFNDLELDLVTRKVFRNGVALVLSQREFSLLEYFLRNPDRPLSRAQIAEHVWNIDFDTGSNIIDVYINHLRKKIEPQGMGRLIHTVTGIGYELRLP